MPRRRNPFDPRAILAALERHYVDYVMIGGLARMLHGTDEITDGVDICPSFKGGNLDRLGAALSELGARGPQGEQPVISEERLGTDRIVSVTTSAGVINIVGSPAGSPNGFVDLRRSATKEHLGHGLRPLIASTGDLARTAAALGRDEDLARLPELRRIMELEVDREQTLAPPAASKPAVTGRPGRGRRVTR